MCLSIPSYIPVATLQAMPLSHEWDDDDHYAHFPDRNPVTKAKLENLSDRAKKAFAIACAEWITRRFDAPEETRLPLDYIEAGWAGVIDFELQCIWEPLHKECLGPIAGPLGLAVSTLTSCFTAIGMGGGEGMASFLSDQCVYILPDPSPFLHWQEAAIPRLQALYPRDEAEPLGPLVPREALDPDIPLDDVKKSAQIYVDRFLAALDFDSNTFLVRPKF